MFEINATLVIFVASFLLFMILLNQIMLKPVGAAMEARKANIDANLEAAKAARAKAEDTVKAYQKHLHEIRTEAQGIINTSLEAANKAHQDEMSRVKAEGRVKLEAAKKDIYAERDALLGQLVGDETQLVEAITSKLLGEKVTISLDTALVSKALNKGLKTSLELELEVAR